jgi:hypothetical protein
MYQAGYPVEQPQSQRRVLALEIRSEFASGRSRDTYLLNTAIEKTVPEQGFGEVLTVTK